MIVAIDGPAGSGKSTLARALAKRCGLTYLDTGAMYRAVTFSCLSQGIDVHDADAVTTVAKNAKIELKAGEKPQVLLDGQDVSEQIRTAEVDQNVSFVAAVPQVREAMVALQRSMAGTADVVAEGRDIGTVVFPAAEVKVFLTADPSARAHRRAVQRTGADAATDASATADAEEEKKILADIEKRDKIDSTRDVAPLVAAEDAVHVDTTSLTLEQEVEKIEALIVAARKGTAEPEQVAAPVATSAKTAPAAPKKKEGTPSYQQPMHAFTSKRDDYFDHGMDEFPWTGKLFYSIIIGICWFFSKLFWPPTFDGRDELIKHVREDMGKGSVIVGNHVSMIEPVQTVAMLWSRGIHARPVYKAEFNKSAVVRYLFSRVGGIPVSRGTADLKAMRRCQHALERGECIVIYPEGTRIKSDDQPVTIHGGFSMIALMGKSDVVPMAIVGARDVTPVGHKFPSLFKHVYMRFGTPITFEELGVKGRKEKLAAMEDRAMASIYAIRDDLRREHEGLM